MNSAAGKNIVHRVKVFVAERRMIQPGSRVVAAVSGGPDSIALLHVLNELRQELDFSLVVAHLDHRLRPDSALDAEFTRVAARALGIDTFVKTADVRAIAEAKRISVEEAGRIARYAFFQEVADSVVGQAIATAHHLNDEVETFFLRLFRGSSPKGLRGIAAMRGRIIRPLLCVNREEIMAFLESESIQFRTDATNLEDATDRNFVRNRLIPLVRERFPDFQKPLKRSMNLVEREESVLEDLASTLFAQVVRNTNRGLSMNVSALRSAHEAIAARVIVKALYEVSGPDARWARSHVDSILKMAQAENPSAEMRLPGGPVIHREYERLVLCHEAPSPLLFDSVVVSQPGAVTIPHSGVTLEFRLVARVNVDDLADHSKTRALFDADHVAFPLLVRGPLPGDRFRPWGVDGTRKLKKTLIDAKIPLGMRRALPLVVKGDEILWIPGVRRSRTAPVTPDTKLVLEIKIGGRVLPNQDRDGSGPDGKTPWI
jgi:tRNA(Ile)-lysidine synthase